MTPPRRDADGGPGHGGLAGDGQGYGGLAGDDRALSSVVGKSLELGLLALYVGLLVSTFYGGVLPDYRTSAGGAVADRTTAAVAANVEDAVPPRNAEVVAVDVAHEIDVPRTIRGDAYAVRLADGSLVLDHPDDRLSRSVPLSLPGGVTAVESSVRSGRTVVVVVESTSSGLRVRLEGR